MVAADHLQVPRQHGLFHHHGIDLGDGTVAHYLEGREILRSPLTEFCQNQVCNVITHENALEKGITLRRAMSRIGEQSYNLLFNNCEHFAIWCKTGIHRSKQAEVFLKNGSLGVLAIGQLLPAALLTGLRVLLEKGLINKGSIAKAKQALEKLTEIRSTLLKNLDSTLNQLDQWFQNDPNMYDKNNPNSSTHILLLQGQRLADELNALEDLETRITELVNQADSQL